MNKNFLWVWGSVWVATIGVSMLAKAGIGEWKNYTDMKNVVALVCTRDAIWAATSGGMFRYTVRDSTFTKFTNSEGLTGNDVSAIGLDENGAIWLGEQSGAIDVYSPSKKSWQYIRDISLSTKQLKSVNAFFSSGDSMYIATGFGVSLFSLSRFEFKDTYSNFGSFANPNVTGVLISRGRFFISTTGGLAVSRPNSTNLAAPESWDVFTNPASANAVAAFRGNVYAGTDAGLYVYQNGTWSLSNGITQAIRTLVSTDSMLYAAVRTAVISVSPSSVVSVLGGQSPALISVAALDSSKRVIVGFRDGGMGIMNPDGSGWTQSVPNGPASNFFSSLAIDENGTLWAASARSSGRGFYSFDGSRWKNYNLATLPQLKTNDYFNIAIGPNNSKWIGSWGGGVALMNSSGDLVRVFDDKYPGLVGSVPTDLKYIVPGKAAADRFGTMWVPLSGSLSGDVLWRMKPDSSWESVRAASSNSFNLVFSVTIDRNGTKWCSNSLPEHQPQFRNFMFYNESVNIPGSMADHWGEVTVADGLTSGEIYCTVEDKNGSLWVGTAAGVTIISEPLRPASHISKVFLGAVRDQRINAIAVDPLNNKWLGTKQGVIVLSPDGTSLLAHYDVTNTDGKLVANNVLSIVFDDKRGFAYFGTEKGLSSLEIAAIETEEKLSSLEVAPNPFILPDEPSVMIKGLVENTTIKILSTTGGLVRQFAAQGGGRAFWDGTDSKGAVVGSGVYVVVAYAENGNQVSTAKIAVVRK